MAIVGFVETKFHFGAVNDEASADGQFTASLHHKFGPAGATVWSRPSVQGFSVNDDDGGVGLWISKFVDHNGSHPGPFSPGIFATKCTDVFFAMDARDCIATAVFTSHVFD